jgi:two-component system response regulator MtrA
MPHKILVVDDDNALREMVGIVLESEGFNVCFHDAGSGALDAFKAEAPDLVLLDVMLPGKDGIEVCEEIRAVSGTPIIMLTAKTESDDVVRGLEAGADDYVVIRWFCLLEFARAFAQLRVHRRTRFKLVH